jgi:hypothetical protein
MDVFLKKKICENQIWVFIDEAILFSVSIEEHARSSEQVLERFGKANLEQPPGKCVFAQPEMHYFVYLITRYGSFHPLRKLELYMNPLCPGLLKMSGHS